MLRKVLCVAALAVGGLVVGLPNASAATGDVTCTDAFAGTARNVIIPAENGCDLSGATVTHDVLVGSDSGVFAEGLSVGHDIVLVGPGDLEVGGATIGHDVNAGPGSSIHLERTTIGHDLTALQPDTVQSGHNAPDSPGGPVRVGHDVLISGSSDSDFVFDGICSMTVGHDFRLTNRSVTFGIGLGDNCVFFGEQGNTIGHDLIVTGNSALATDCCGPSTIEVGGNQIGHDLIFTNNTALEGGFLEVSDNTVAHDAICEGNSPPVGSPEPFDGPNTVGGRNTCG
jgi:hypothetical protein